MRAGRPAQTSGVVSHARLDTTKRRRRDMTSHYKPNSAGYRGEPFGIVRDLDPGRAAESQHQGLCACIYPLRVSLDQHLLRKACFWQPFAIISGHNSSGPPADRRTAKYAAAGKVDYDQEGDPKWTLQRFLKDDIRSKKSWAEEEWE